MSSRLIPRDQAPASVRAYSYRALEECNIPRGPLTPSHSGESSSDASELHARIAQLEQQIARDVATAREAGRREGEAAGRAHADAVVRPVLDQLARSSAELVEARPRLRKELEEEAVKLSLAISRRILRRELTVDPAILTGLVSAAFERIGRQEVTRITTHPAHAEVVRAALSQITSRQIEIFSDGSHELGTLILETSRGALDASIESQLREIEIGLADRLKGRRE